MNHGVFQPIVEELERCHPGVYGYEIEVNEHGVSIFNVRKAGVGGRVEILAASSSSPSDNFLSTIHLEFDEHGSETISADGPSDIVGQVEDWSIERAWTPPSPSDLSAEKRRLQKVANGLAKNATPVELSLASEEESKIAPSSRDRFEADLVALAPDLVQRRFPPDKQGRVALKTTVLLARYESSEQSPNRELCLVAAGPARRKTCDPKRNNCPLITMTTTASNARLHLNAYERPLDLDFLRMGVRV